MKIEIQAPQAVRIKDRNEFDRFSSILKNLSPKIHICKIVPKSGISPNAIVYTGDMFDNLPFIKKHVGNPWQIPPILLSYLPIIKE